MKFIVEKPKNLFSGGKNLWKLIDRRNFGSHYFKGYFNPIFYGKSEQYDLFWRNPAIVEPKNTVNQNFLSAKIVNLNI